MLLQILKVDELQRRLMGRLKHDLRCRSGFKCLLPPRRT